MVLFGLVSQTFGGSDQDAARGTGFGPAIPIRPEAPLFDRVFGLLGRDPAWEGA
jgi:hypothetical protein